MENTITSNQKIISYLTFSLIEENFALNVARVVNILEMQPIIKVPNAPDYIPGIINLRGEVLPIVDGNLKLSLGKTRVTNNTCILVIETSISDTTLKFGVLVDSVKDVLEFEDEQILPSPAIGDKFETEIISGVVEQNGRFIMIININKLLDFNEVLEIDKKVRNEVTGKN